MDFWFGRANEPDHGKFRAQWFRKDAAFDAQIGARFGALTEGAAHGAHDDWASTPQGALALVIVLDQFPRNLFRDDARAFATDAKARTVAASAVAKSLDRLLEPVQRMFLYLPFEHAEDIAEQRRAVALMESIDDAAVRAGAADFARKHLAIVERFGRFQHRNRALGSASTPDEEVFLAQPGSGF